MRPYLSLAVGLIIGIAGAILFIQSMPPKEGSAEERADKLESDLKQANHRLAAMEAANPSARRPGRTLADGARNLAENLREGKPVSPDDIFRATQPLIRDLAPLFDRMRVRELQRQTDAKAGELARKYALNPTQQKALAEWLNQNAEDEAKRFTDLISQEGTKLEDLAKASKDVRVDDGLEKFMERTLSGDRLLAFKTDSMTEKVSRVQQEADMKVTRLDAIVSLDDAQRGEVFGVMARGARDFDPAMQFEGLGTDRGALATGQSKQDAVLAVLRPDQRQIYQDEQEKRRTAARQEMESLGLTPPADWNPSELLDF